MPMRVSMCTGLSCSLSVSGGYTLVGTTSATTISLGMRCAVPCSYWCLSTIRACVCLLHRHGNVHEPGFEGAPVCVSDYLSVVQLVDGRNRDGQLGHHRGNTGVDTARGRAPPTVPISNVNVFCSCVH